MWKTSVCGLVTCLGTGFYYVDARMLLGLGLLVSVVLSSGISHIPSLSYDMRGNSSVANCTVDIGWGYYPYSGFAGNSGSYTDFLHGKRLSM
jgi:hypothetical protein